MYSSIEVCNWSINFIAADTAKAIPTLIAALNNFAFKLATSRDFPVFSTYLL